VAAPVATAVARRAQTALEAVGVPSRKPRDPGCSVLAGEARGSKDGYMIESEARALESDQPVRAVTRQGRGRGGQRQQLNRRLGGDSVRHGGPGNAVGAGDLREVRRRALPAQVVAAVHAHAVAHNEHLAEDALGDIHVFALQEGGAIPAASVRIGAVIEPGFRSFPLVETKIPCAASPSKQLAFVEESVGWSVGMHEGGGAGLVVTATVVVVAVVTVTVVAGGRGGPSGRFFTLRSRPAVQSKPACLYRLSYLALHASPFFKQTCRPAISAATEPDRQPDDGETFAGAAGNDPARIPATVTAVTATRSLGRHVPRI
jgi:hypothetical protein